MATIPNLDPKKFDEKLAASKARQKKLKGNRKDKQANAFAKWRHNRATTQIIEKRHTLDEQIEARAHELLPKLLAKERIKIQHQLDKETKKQRTAILHDIKLKLYQLQVARSKVPDRIHNATAQHLELMRAKVASQTNRLIYIARHTLILFDVFNELNIFPPFGGFLAWAYQYEYFSVKEFRLAFPGVEANYYNLLNMARREGFIRHIHQEGTIKQFSLSIEGREYTRKLLKYIYKKSGFEAPENMRKKQKNPKATHAI